MFSTIGRLFDSVLGLAARSAAASHRARFLDKAHVRVWANPEGEVELVVWSPGRNLPTRANVGKGIDAMVIQKPEFLNITFPKGSQVVYEVHGNATRSHVVVNAVRHDQWIAVSVLIPRKVEWHICAEPPVVVSKQRFNRMVEADIRSEAARAGRERKKAAKQAAKQPAAQPEAPAPVGDAVEPPPSSTDAPAETPPEASGEPDAAANTGAQV